MPWVADSHTFFETIEHAKQSLNSSVWRQELPTQDTHGLKPKMASSQRAFMALLLVRFNKGATTAAWHFSVVEVAAGQEPKEAAWAWPERPYFRMVGNMNSLCKGSNEKFPATKNGKVPQDVSPTSEDLEDKMSVVSIKNDA